MRTIINKTKYAFAAAMLAILFMPFASATCEKGRIPDPFNPNCENNPPLLGDIAARFIPVIPVFIGVALFGVLSWGAIQIFSAGPNDESKKKGIQTIQNAVTGVVLLFISVGIITLIESILGIKILYGVFVK